MGDPVSAITAVTGLMGSMAKSRAATKAAEMQRPTGYMTAYPVEMEGPFDRHYRSLLAGILGLPDIVEHETKYNPDTPKIIHTPMPEEGGGPLAEIYRREGGR